MESFMIKLVLDILLPSIEIASVYGLAVLAVLIAFRVANFADLTIDGSFTLGGAVSALALVNGMPSGLALVLGFLAGSVAGVCTALLHTRIGVNRLLAGIITMTLLYTLNLRLMGRSNMSLGETSVVFDLLPAGPTRVTVGLVLALIVALLLFLLLRTDLGHFIRAAGENPKVVVRRGYTEESLLLVSIPIANALAGLAGGLAAQQQGFADVGMGAGIVIMCLAALLLGEAVLPPNNVQRLLIAGLLGMLLYQVLVTVCLRLGLNPWDLKLYTGVLLISALVTKRYFLMRRGSANIGSDPL
jgi:putative tryptophan/tyrosine transport system permease protein